MVPAFLSAGVRPSDFEISLLVLNNDPLYQGNTFHFDGAEIYTRL